MRRYVPAGEASQRSTPTLHDSRSDSRHPANPRSGIAFRAAYCMTVNENVCEIERIP